MVGTEGRVKAALHALGGAMIDGASGKITTLAILLSLHPAGAEVPAGMFPHAAVNTYLAVIV